MPQLDIDLFDDFLFFAFVSLLFGVSDDESEEAVIDLNAEITLVQAYLAKRQAYDAQVKILKQLFVTSLSSKNTI